MNQRNSRLFHSPGAIAIGVMQLLCSAFSIELLASHRENSFYNWLIGMY
jgi:hypothetical protein